MQRAKISAEQTGRKRTERGRKKRERREKKKRGGKGKGKEGGGKEGGEEGRGEQEERKKGEKERGLVSRIDDEWEKSQALVITLWAFSKFTRSLARFMSMKRDTLYSTAFPYSSIFFLWLV